MDNDNANIPNVTNEEVVPGTVPVEGQSAVAESIAIEEQMAAGETPAPAVENPAI